MTKGQHFGDGEMTVGAFMVELMKRMAENHSPMATVDVQFRTLTSALCDVKLNLNLLEIDGRRVPGERAEKDEQDGVRWRFYRDQLLACGAGPVPEWAFQLAFARNQAEADRVIDLAMRGNAAAVMAQTIANAKREA